MKPITASMISMRPRSATASTKGTICGGNGMSLSSKDLPRRTWSIVIFARKGSVSPGTSATRRQDDLAGEQRLDVAQQRQSPTDEP